MDDSELFPAGDLYPAYVADPHRPTNELSVGFGSSAIPDSRSPRIHLSAGGRFGMMKFGPNRPDARRWQVSLDAGLDAVFDSHYKNDAILAGDGNYGLTITSASPASRLGLKMAFRTIPHTWATSIRSAPTPSGSVTRGRSSPSARRGGFAR